MEDLKVRGEFKSTKNIRKVTKKLKKSEKNRFLTAKSNTASEIEEKAKNLKDLRVLQKSFKSSSKSLEATKKHCMISISIWINI